MNSKWPKWSIPILEFLTGKGLLIVPDITPRPSQVISLIKALKAGRELEPRIIEVLPAALIHFPSNFEDLDRVPPELNEIINAIYSDKNEGIELEGIPFSAMKRWANEVLTDKRIVPAKEKRKMVSYRLSPEAIRTLKTRSARENISETQFIERLIMS